MNCCAPAELRLSRKFVAEVSHLLLRLINLSDLAYSSPIVQLLMWLPAPKSAQRAHLFLYTQLSGHMLYNVNTCVYWGAVLPLLPAQMSCSESALADFVLQSSMEPNEDSFWEAWCRSISLHLCALESEWSCSLCCWGHIVPNLMKSLAVFCWPYQTGCLSCSYPSLSSPCNWGEVAKVRCVMSYECLLQLLFVPTLCPPIRILWNR